ncbi:HTH-type transcriptional regulator CmtR [Nocardia farcinica]|uniref:HTH-type transcriptional regulator CmtR n=2 Tax=Nocardia farcinica TaxID=37329 RepID=A0A449HDB9_NOCFR|nr:HTH-type transcriptional regulator CmtR [Nocardia farcinica]
MSVLVATAPAATVQIPLYYFGMETAPVLHIDALARFGHALSDPTRARIMVRLRQQPGYPSELAEQLGVSRQILSNHLACLRGCGLVVAVPEGRRVRYELADARVGAALGDLLGLVLAVDPACCPASDEQGCC